MNHRLSRLLPLPSQDVFQIFLCMISCALYVSRTYGMEGPGELDLTINVMFTIDFVLRLYCSEKRLLSYPMRGQRNGDAHPVLLSLFSRCFLRRQFLCSPFAVIDYVTILPVFYKATTSSRTDGLLLSLQFLRFTRILKMMKLFSTMQHSATGTTASCFMLEDDPLRA